MKNIKMNDFNILCFDWNASGMRICETASKKKAQKGRAGLNALIAKTCSTPDFFDYFRDIIREKMAIMVVFSTQDEDSSGSYFHSKFLPIAMTELNYTLLKGKELDGIGDLASGVMPENGENIKPKSSTLRQSIYVYDSWMNIIEEGEKRLNKKFGSKGQMTFRTEYDGRKMGAIASYVNVSGLGRLCFIAVDLPENKTYQNENFDLDNKLQAMDYSNGLFLINAMQKFYFSLSEDHQNEAGFRPDIILLHGSMYFNLHTENQSALEKIKELTDFKPSTFKTLQKFDSLSNMIKESKPPYDLFKEGVDAEGPQFPPTWKMWKDRKEECSRSDKDTLVKIMTDNCYYPKTPQDIGWHDRILYFDNPDNIYKMKCLEYTPIDSGNIKNSTHLAVMAFFQFEKN